MIWMYFCSAPSRRDQPRWIRKKPPSIHSQDVSPSFSPEIFQVPTRRSPSAFRSAGGACSSTCCVSLLFDMCLLSGYFGVFSVRRRHLTLMSRLPACSWPDVRAEPELAGGSWMRSATARSSIASTKVHDDDRVARATTLGLLSN
jgi:hypothetical protein